MLAEELQQRPATPKRLGIWRDRLQPRPPRATWWRSSIVARMQPAIAIAVALACLGACGRESSPPAPATAQAAAIDLALGRGARFLSSRQQADGAIPSRTYAALKDGWSLTPLAVLALRMVPLDDATHRDAYRRGVDYVATIAGPGGAIREAPEVSYPLYAYAIGALVLGAPDNRRHRAVHGRLLEALRALQLSERTGWRPADPSFGGWSYATRPPLRTDGQLAESDLAANLSATLLAAGALLLGGAQLGDPALVAARGFVERCQNLGSDGGFFFSPALADGNKAGALADGRYRSYGSMTADGLRALLRLGRPLSDPRVAAASAWLARRFDATRNPGDFPPVAEVRRESSYYYWAWSAAHATRHLANTRWAEALAAELLRRQGPDGSWKNPASEMREDDPIIATSFALAALALARSVLVAEPRSHAY